MPETPSSRLPTAHYMFVSKTHAAVEGDVAFTIDWLRQVYQLEIPQHQQQAPQVHSKEGELPHHRRPTTQP